MSKKPKPMGGPSVGGAAGGISPNAMGETLRQDGYTLALPRVSIETAGGPTMPPRFGAGLDLSLPQAIGGGNLGLDATYQQKPTGPADWGAMLRYQQRF